MPVVTHCAFGTVQCDIERLRATDRFAKLPPRPLHAHPSYCAIICATLHALAPQHARVGTICNLLWQFSERFVRCLHETTKYVAWEQQQRGTVQWSVHARCMHRQETPGCMFCVGLLCERLRTSFVYSLHNIIVTQTQTTLLSVELLVSNRLLRYNSIHFIWVHSI